MKLTKDNYKDWTNVLQCLATHYRMSFSIENVELLIENTLNTKPFITLEYVTSKMDFEIHYSKTALKSITPSRLPLVVTFNDGQVAVVTKMDAEGNFAVIFAGDGQLESVLEKSFVQQHISSCIVIRPCNNIKDVRVDAYIKPYNKNWFWKIALADWRKYIDIMVASVIANVLALSGMVFSMQIYDRVVPAQSESTLWVLFAGVMIAILFEFTMRMIRAYISDVIGKRADLRVSDHVFSRALRIRNDARPKSTGTFISQIRELESVRELITSTTFSTLADLPFFLLFVSILWFIGGPLAWVVMCAVPLIVIPGLIAQIPLARLSNEGMRESAIRNATLIESVQGIDDIKSMRAEARFQNQWNHSCAVSASVSMKQRLITNFLVVWTQELQTMVYVFVLLCGAYLVINGDITTGTLVGASILSSRTVAPLAQVTGVLSRWQSAKVALKGLNDLMQKPLDQAEGKHLVHLSHVRGDFELQNISVSYDEENSDSSLTIPSLKIFPGEKIAILGRNGSGKSTLLRVLSGMLKPQSGSVLLDKLELSFIDPLDVRRDVGLLEQYAHLFFGSIRDNVVMGRPMASDADIQRALRLSGAESCVAKQKEGLNHIIHEGGIGLSGGERQTLLLARHFICDHKILLLDEPTSMLDEISEQRLISAMESWVTDKTLVVATHRLSILGLVDRIIVLDKGQIVLDGPRNTILQQLQSSQPSTNTQ
ncbi:MAG: type I secretion system permease/ATPase [Vibrio sp.]|uniref:type I secretion system permease/ATPase n=1 Tax=Vibrio sp. TaxID=678 RepID=UPI003A89DBFB